MKKINLFVTSISLSAMLISNSTSGVAGKTIFDLIKEEEAQHAAAAAAAPVIAPAADPAIIANMMNELALLRANNRELEEQLDQRDRLVLGLEREVRNRDGIIDNLNAKIDDPEVKAENQALLDDFRNLEDNLRNRENEVEALGNDFDLLRARYDAVNEQRDVSLMASKALLAGDRVHIRGVVEDIIRSRTEPYLNQMAAIAPTIADHLGVTILASKQLATLIEAREGDETVAKVDNFMMGLYEDRLNGAARLSESVANSFGILRLHVEDTYDEENEISASLHRELPALIGAETSQDEINGIESLLGQHFPDVIQHAQEVSMARFELSRALENLMLHPRDKDTFDILKKYLETQGELLDTLVEQELKISQMQRRANLDSPSPLPLVDIVDTVVTEKKALKADLVRSQDQITSLQADLDAAQTESRERQARVAELEAALELAQTVIGEEQVNADSLRTQLQDAQAEGRASHDRVIALEAELAAQRDQFLNASSSSALHDQELEEKEEHMRKVKQNIDLLKEKIEGYLAEPSNEFNEFFDIIRPSVSFLFPDILEYDVVNEHNDISSNRDVFFQILQSLSEKIGSDSDKTLRLLDVAEEFKSNTLFYADSEDVFKEAYNEFMNKLKD